MQTIDPAGEKRDPRHWRAEGLLLLITFIWGFSFVIVKQSLEEVPVFYFNALRFTVASAAFLPFAMRQGKALARAGWPALGLSAFLFTGFAFQASGLQFTSPSKSALITASSVLFVPVFLWLLFRQKSDSSVVAGIIVAFAGLYLLSVPPIRIWVNPGDLLTGVGAVAWAFHIILVGRFSPQHPVLVLTALQMFFTGACFWITTLALHQVRPVPLSVLPALLYTGALSTSLCFGLQAWAQRHTSAARAALLFTMEPLFASAASYYWIGERLTLRETAGGLLIVAGVIVAELGYHLRAARARRRKHAVPL